MTAPPPQTGRRVLDGVPRVRFYDGSRCPEDFPFPSCVRAALEFLEDDLGCAHVRPTSGHRLTQCAYAHLTATCGIAFSLLWNPDKWDPGNTGVTAVCDDPVAAIGRAFASVGRECTVLGNAETPYGGPEWEAFAARHTPEDEMRGAIILSVRDHARPVLALGVVGPPECCLVTGYDRGGEALVGWSYFQEADDCREGLSIEPDGQFRRTGWYANTPAVILIGERTPEPDAGDVRRTTLEWALDLMAPHEVHGRKAGAAAYDAWAAALLRDEEFAAEDLEPLQERQMAHNGAVGAVAESRHYGHVYLREAAIGAPLSGELLAAAECFRAEHDLMWEVWGAIGGPGLGDDKARALASRDAREKSAAIILAAKAKDAEAREHIARALEG